MIFQAKAISFLPQNISHALDKQWESFRRPIRATFSVMTVVIFDTKNISLNPDLRANEPLKYNYSFVQKWPDIS